MSSRWMIALLTAFLLPAAAAAEESVSIRTTGAECIGVVSDLIPSVRKSGQITVDGAPVLIRSEHNHVRVDRDTLKRQCAEDGKVVEVRVDRA